VIQHSVDTLGPARSGMARRGPLGPQGHRSDLPNRHQIDTAINEQLIVELYSK
jgi:hypothetical protein